MLAELPMRCVSSSDSRCRVAPFRRSAFAIVGTILLFAMASGPASGQEAAAPVAASIFEIERPWSFAEQAAAPVERTAPSTNLSQYLARYYLVTTTLTGTGAGALTGALAVFLVCR